MESAVSLELLAEMIDDMIADEWSLRIFVEGGVTYATAVTDDKEHYRAEGVTWADAVDCLWSMMYGYGDNVSSEGME